MQTTLTSTIIKYQSNYAEISSQLIEVVLLHKLRKSKKAANTKLTFSYWFLTGY